MVNHPLVSIVIPTHNNGTYLPDVINRVLNQSIKSKEVIVVDDGSTDDTTQILESFSRRIRYIALPHCSGGPSRPRNVGIKMANGTYVAMLDSDDLMLNGKLKEQIDLLERHSDIPFVFSNFRNFEGSYEFPHDFLADHRDFHNMPKTKMEKEWYRIKGSDALEILMNDNFIGTPSVVIFRRDLFNTIGPFNENLKASEDLDYWIRVAQHHDFGFINKELIKRRIHAMNYSSSTQFLRNQLHWADSQKANSLPKGARLRLNRRLSSLHFSIGYLNKQDGQRQMAIKHYLSSLKYQKSNWKVLKALVKACVPL